MPCTSRIELCDWLMLVTWLHGLQVYDWLISTTSFLIFFVLIYSRYLSLHKLHCVCFVCFISLRSRSSLRSLNSRDCFVSLYTTLLHFASFLDIAWFRCNIAMIPSSCTKQGLGNVLSAKVRTQHVGSLLTVTDVASFLVEAWNQQPKSRRAVVLPPLLL